MNYVVVEIKKTSSGVDTICESFNDKNAADGIYFSRMAAASSSEYPVHSVVMLNELGLVERTNHYRREESEG